MSGELINLLTKFLAYIDNMVNSTFINNEFSYVDTNILLYYNIHTDFNMQNAISL